MMFVKDQVANHYKTIEHSHRMQSMVADLDTAVDNPDEKLDEAWNLLDRCLEHADDVAENGALAVRKEYLMTCGVLLHSLQTAFQRVDKKMPEFGE